MKEIPEVEIVDELMEYLEEMTDNEAGFIQKLYELLDPHLPFLEQRSEKQSDWLYCIHEKYCNLNEDAFEDFND